MALITVAWRSKRLKLATETRVLLNQNAKPPYPVYYLLHGLSDDAGYWSRMTALEQYAENLPFLIVMPYGARAWYSDSLLGNYESHFMKELIPFIERTFPVRRQRRYRAVGGLSMGGYGALKLGLKYPRQFGVIAAHSAAANFLGWNAPPTDLSDDTDYIRGYLNRNENDPFKLAETCPIKLRPHLYFDCGRDDFLYPDNNLFSRHLRKLDYEHTYRRFKGEHNWVYWNEHIKDGLNFAVEAMKH